MQPTLGEQNPTPGSCSTEVGALLWHPRKLGWTTLLRVGDAYKVPGRRKRSRILRQSPRELALAKRHVRTSPCPFRRHLVLRRRGVSGTKLGLGIST
jgi:hypothetical protein